MGMFDQPGGMFDGQIDPQKYAMMYGSQLLALLGGQQQGQLGGPDQVLPSGQRPDFSPQQILSGVYPGMNPPPIQYPQNYMHNPFFTPQYGWRNGPRNPAIGS